MREAWNKGKFETHRCKGCEKQVRKWQVYCGTGCYWDHREKKKLIEKNCVICKKEFWVDLHRKRKQCCSRKCGYILAGQKISVAKKGFKHSLETIERMKIANKLKALKKEKNPAWKGGITAFNKLERDRFQKTMQKQVFERDDYTCQLCFKRGGILHVDHIQPFAEYIEGRFNMDNCRTLCVKCHYFITFKKIMPKNNKWGNIFKEVVAYDR